jgi:hypothetical protein
VRVSQRWLVAIAICRSHGVTIRDIDLLLLAHNFAAETIREAVRGVRRQKRSAADDSALQKRESVAFVALICRSSLARPGADDDFFVFSRDDDSLMLHLQFGQVRKLMDELEDEMADISKEQVDSMLLLHNAIAAMLKADFSQKLLTDIVKKTVADHSQQLRDKLKQEIDLDVANGFITRALQYHYEKNYFNIMPSNVKLRKSEEELRDKL